MLLQEQVSVKKKGNKQDFREKKGEYSKPVLNTGY